MVIFSIDPRNPGSYSAQDGRSVVSGLGGDAIFLAEGKILPMPGNGIAQGYRRIWGLWPDFALQFRSTDFVFGRVPGCMGMYEMSIFTKCYDVPH